MRAPTERRGLDEIIDEAVEIIGPLAEHVAQCRATVGDRLCRELSIASPVTVPRSPFVFVHRIVPALPVAELCDYLRALRRARVAAPASWPRDRINAEISGVQSVIEQAERLPRPKWKKPLNLVALRAVRAAADLLDPDIERARAYLSLLPDDQARQLATYQLLYRALDYECPWRKRLTLYPKGAWCKLSETIYEAIAGKIAPDLMHYCRMVPLRA
jgi:hypothetical protein